jgi:hypothetical protein
MAKNKNNSSELSNGEPGPFTTGMPFLYQSAEEQLALQNFLWDLLVDNCIKLQLSSASIKAGVTSLLDHTIFWAHTTQYEFLRSIDESIDEVSELAMLMMLAFRIQAQRLELKIEPQDLNDILSRLRDQHPGASAGLDLDIHFPPSEAAVTIDYGFFLIALKLIIEVESGLVPAKRNISITTSANGRYWFLDLDGIQPESIDFFRQVRAHHTSFIADYDHHQADKLIRLILAYWICQLQKVEFDQTASESELNNHLRLAIPAA